MVPPTFAPTGFFRLEKRERWWIVTPDGSPFFSIGVNHLDPATLRYPENIHIWREKYDGDIMQWIDKSVRPNLLSWGFNSVGWVQDVGVRQWRHSRSFTRAEYAALKMPYCHMLPFTESHQWESHTVNYDFRSAAWKEWCEYVARSHCAELYDEPNLIGYFDSDCPCWIHNFPQNEWRGPIFDPELLSSPSGRKELSELAQLYYATIRDAIRRFDKNHLLFGDRFEANAPIAMEVIQAASENVDAFSLQDFKAPVKSAAHWHSVTEMPVLLADTANIEFHTKVGEISRHDGKWYIETLEALKDNPGCVGLHLCGSYQRNRARRYGLIDEMEIPDSENLALIAAANKTMAEWVSSHEAPSLG